MDPNKKMPRQAFVGAAVAAAAMDAEEAVKVITDTMNETERPMTKEEQLALALTAPTVRRIGDEAASQRASAFQHCYVATLKGISRKNGPSRQIVRYLLRQRAKAKRAGVIA